MKLIEKVKAMFNKRQRNNSGIPDMNEGTYNLKERFPKLGDRPISYRLESNVVDLYLNIGAYCDAFLGGISNLSELNEGYYDQTIDILTHFGIDSLKQQRLNHQHSANMIDLSIKQDIDKMRDEINRYEETLEKVQSAIAEIEKANKKQLKTKEDKPVK